MPTLYALAPFTHGAGKYKPGDAIYCSDPVARELIRAGLATADGAPAVKKPVASGKAAPSFVLPPALPSLAPTLNASADGDSPEPTPEPEAMADPEPEPIKRKRGRPRKSDA